MSYCRGMCSWRGAILTIPPLLRSHPTAIGCNCTAYSVSKDERVSGRPFRGSSTSPVESLRLPIRLAAGVAVPAVAVGTYPDIIDELPVDSDKLPCIAGTSGLPNASVPLPMDNTF